jgi:hypothetical protein
MTPSSQPGTTNLGAQTTPGRAVINRQEVRDSARSTSSYASGGLHGAHVQVNPPQLRLSPPLMWTLYLASAESQTGAVKALVGTIARYVDS